MAEADFQDTEISFFALGTTLLRSRWRIARWMLLGAVVTAVLVLSKPVLYRASASFVSQGGDAAHAGLAASLAGQFGVTLPGSNQSFSPDFYSKLLTSRVVLLPVVQDTFVVPEMGGRRVSFLALFKVPGRSAAEREDRGVKLLAPMVVTSVDKNTGVVEFSVATQWRSVSLAIATMLLDGINHFDERTRQTKAAAERQFTEGRLAVAADDLRVAEDRLAHFLQANRQLGSSPELTLEQQRIQRDLDFRQQVFVSLSQSDEETRLRELRNTPVITVVEPPAAPALPESRKGVVSVLLGLLMGGFVGVFLVFASETMSRHGNGGNAEADEFVRALREVTGAWRKLLFWRA